MGMPDSNYRTQTLFSGTSPAAASTVVAGTLVGLSQEAVAVIDAQLLGATGGTLDVYIQSSMDADQAGGGTWYDVIHYTQLAAAAGAIRWIVTLSRGFNKIAAVPNSANPVSGTPTLTANTIIPDALGNALRVVLVAGAGTSAGAAIVIKAGTSK